MPDDTDKGEDGLKRAGSQIETKNAKRIQLDKASATLRRPFRSPLKGQAQLPAAATIIKADITTETLKEVSDSQLSISSTFQRRYQRKPPESKAVLLLKKEVAELERNLKREREEADTIAQALRILNESKMQDLDEATLKWRNAARQMVETVFESTCQRIDRMGGVDAWKERKLEDHQLNRWGCPDNGGKDEDDEPEGLEDNDSIFDKEEMANRYYENIKEFTIDVMLVEMHIDPAALGYSSELRTWIE